VVELTYVNLLLHIWCNFQHLECSSFVLEYFKLIEITMVQNLCNVENEQYFSNLMFLKSKFDSRPIINMCLVITMFSHKLLCNLLKFYIKMHIDNNLQNILEMV
jgi:hypothetical protein